MPPVALAGDHSGETTQAGRTSTAPARSAGTPSVPVLVEQYAVVGDENDAKVAAQRWCFGPKAFKTYFNVRNSKKILRLANSKIPSE